MASILLVIIYIAFISLGLPDALLGAAWPSMYGTMHVPVSYAGMIGMIIAGGTILSSLLSDRLLRRLGTGRVTLISVTLTAIALFGFSISGSFWQLCLWGIPYGLGAGSVDAALNNFVSLHYKSRHMSWLHCFWGIGATSGPYIMGLCLTRGLSWNAGYRSIGVIQCVLVACLLLSLPLWKAHADRVHSAHPHSQPKLRDVIVLPGAKATLTAFFCYCAVEATAGLWAGSYLALYRGVDMQSAAKWVALFYLGITLGRLVGGFASNQLGDRRMVRIGQSVSAIALALLFLAPTACSPAALFLLGAGFAPIYPSLLHETPANFGAENTQAIMGIQMACAAVGATFMPPLFGVLTNVLGIGCLPFYLLLLVVLMTYMAEHVNRLRKTGAGGILPL